jgi:hypothetical protein
MSDNTQQSDGDEQPAALVPSSGPDPDQMAADYLPEGDDWLAKTRLDLNDPHAVAALMQFERMFPEVDDLQPIIDEFVDDFLRGRTSVGGESRKEYNRLLESMFGGHPDDSPESKFAAALAGDMDDD